MTKKSTCVDRQAREEIKRFRDDIYGDNGALFDREGNNVSRQVENWIDRALFFNSRKEVVEEIKKMVIGKMEQESERTDIHYWRNKLRGEQLGKLNSLSKPK